MSDFILEIKGIDKTVMKFLSIFDSIPLITVNKKTLSQVYNQVAMCNDLGFPNFQKGEPINNLMKEIKRSINKKVKQKNLFDKIRLWLKKYF